jgi:hypothetical protein
MEEKKYNFGSPEVQKFLGLSPNVTLRNKQITMPPGNSTTRKKLVDRNF